MRWKEGERASLWAELPAVQVGRAKANNSEEAKQQSCMRLSALGRPGPAVQRLTSQGVAHDTPAVRSKLMGKFPYFDHDRAPPRLYPRPPKQFDVDTVVVSLNSFPRFSGPGPTGLRAEFLVQCVKTDDDGGSSGLFA